MTDHLERRTVIWLRTGVTGIRLSVRKQLHSVVSILSCVTVQRLPSSLIRSSKMCQYCWRYFLKLVVQTEPEWACQKCTNRKISEIHVSFFFSDWVALSIVTCYVSVTLLVTLGCLLFTEVKWGGAGLVWGREEDGGRGNCSGRNGTYERKRKRKVYHQLFFIKDLPQIHQMDRPWLANSLHCFHLSVIAIPWQETTTLIAKTLNIFVLCDNDHSSQL